MGTSGRLHLSGHSARTEGGYHSLPSRSRAFPVLPASSLIAPVRIYFSGGGHLPLG